MIYTGLGSIPELVKLSKEEKKKIWLKYYWKIFRTRFSPWAGLIAIMALTQLGQSFDQSYGSLIGATLGSFIFWQVMMESIHSCIREDNK